LTVHSIQCILASLGVPRFRRGDTGGSIAGGAPTPKTSAHSSAKIEDEIVVEFDNALALAA